jgi:hypothetical protein
MLNHCLLRLVPNAEHQRVAPLVGMMRSDDKNGSRAALRCPALVRHSLHAAGLLLGLEGMTLELLGLLLIRSDQKAKDILPRAFVLLARKAEARLHDRLWIDFRSVVSVDTKYRLIHVRFRFSRSL